MNLIYSCVFFQESYLNLLELLLKSYVLFGGDTNTTKYLVICDPNFQTTVKTLFEKLNINGDIWCLDLKTLFEAGYSRLKIFDYPSIHLYSKIFYLDCDILITNLLSRIFDLKLENKLYTFIEGHTNDVWNGIDPDWWGKQFFKENNPCVPGFTSGMMLFPNCQEIKSLFEKILQHIHQHIAEENPIHQGLDQPFIVYHAIKENLYNNTDLIGLCVNNYNQYNNYYGETITHFPGCPGHYESKIYKMSRYLRYVLSQDLDDYLKVNDEEYTNKISENKIIFKELEEICISSNEPIEGNCFTEHLNIHNKIDSLIYKQLNHYSLGKISQNIMEIGFNAGHYSLLYLLANPNSKITIFDLCEHKYTIECFEYLDKLFPERLTLYKGDSRNTIPRFISEHPTAKFDLIHIDGGHFGDIPYLDFTYSSMLSNGVIIFDDTQIKALNEIVDDSISKGLSQEIHLYNTYEYCHRIIYHNYLVNRIYSWGNDTITFFANGKMNAFGQGQYKIIGDHFVKADFGYRKHYIKFDKDYKSFKSVRYDDFELVSGYCLNDIFTPDNDSSSKIFTIYNIQEMREREENYFDLDTYSNSTSLQFNNREHALSHWYSIGKKQGHVYSKFGHQTLLKIIVPVFNEDVLLEPFIEYYGRLIGYENIIILDNLSTSSTVKEIYNKFKDKITIFYTKYHFDHYYNNGLFDILVSSLSNECKYISKIDCDEFLCFYDYNYDRFFGKEHFQSYLRESNKHIASFFLNNLFTKEIMDDDRNFVEPKTSHWVYFEHINNFQNQLRLKLGKTLLNTNLSFENKSLSFGNHNCNKNIFLSCDMYKIICLHLCNVDIDGRIMKGERIIPNNILSLKKSNFQKFLEELETYNPTTGFHKVKELYDFYKNKENYYTNLLHKPKIYLETNIIQATISDSKVYTKFISE